VTDGREMGLVLIPGAGLGGWIWERMTPALELPCLPAEFPGRKGGDDETTGLGLEDYVRYVRGQVEAMPAERIAIVAHSLGGVIGLRLARDLSARLAGFVGIGAAIPRGGGSFVSSLALPKRALTSVLMRVAGTKPPESVIRRGLASDLSEGDADELVRRFVPESRAVYFERTGVDPPAVARAYVVLTEDREFGVPQQRRMADNLGAGDVRGIASGHMAMISHPDELAGVVNEFCRGLE
jgi:pimeloyl-ACP methyl ester carboxylesterase